MTVLCSKLLLLCVCCGILYREASACDVRARTEAGWVCGLRRLTEDRKVYASFRGVPYAKQPLGELRFKELQPAEPWDDTYDAFVEGPSCPQDDPIYGPLRRPQGMSEACIYANIHVPIDALPRPPPNTTIDTVLSRLVDLYTKNDENESGAGLPVMMFIHGGGFLSGAGDADGNGPEYLVNRGVIVVTFNYRLNVFGFLSLNSSSIPGNNGLRDQITLLRWVQRNIRQFGGNPDEVTLAGQSAGSSTASLLAISPATEGLFKRVILMSGTALGGFYSTSPAYARDMAGRFVAGLGIESTDPEEIHRQLIDVPLERIMEVNRVLQATYVASVFAPVVEHPHPGVTIVLDDDPEVLVSKGRGRDLPLIVGINSNEGAFFLAREGIEDILNVINEDPTYVLPPSLNYTVSPDRRLSVADELMSRYFNGTPTIEGWTNMCADSYFQYPSLKLAALRAANGGAPVYLYQFSYEAQISIFGTVFAIEYTGAMHLEDLSYVFRLNSILGDYSMYPFKTDDIVMKDWMTNFIVNFMKYSDPTRSKDEVSPWPPLDNTTLRYQDINRPLVYRYVEPTAWQLDTMQFFDDLISSNS